MFLCLTIVIVMKLFTVDLIFCRLCDNKIAESNSYKELCCENIQVEEKYDQVVCEHVAQ